MVRQTATLFAATLIAVLTATSVAAEDPAFDCTKASGEIETLICGEAGLAVLDQQLSDVYDASLRKLKDSDDEQAAVKSLKAHQRGWIKGRNDCWKADSKRDCTENAYRTRIALLQAQYGLVSGGKPVFYTCNGNPADELVATFFPTDPQAVRLERGDNQVIALQARSGSGARYLGEFGILFWEHHGTAQVEWPQGTKFECTVR